MPSFDPLDSLAALPALAMAPTQFQIVETPKAWYEQLLQGIDRACNRIYLVALYLQDDAAGLAILTALYQAKQRQPSLDIKVFVDYHRAQRGRIGQANQGGNARCYQQLAQQYPHPIEIYGVPVKSRELLGVLHAKGFVIDDTVLYSGASINEVYLHHGDKYRLDRYHLLNHAKLADTFVNYTQHTLLHSAAVVRLDHAPIVALPQLKKDIRHLKQQLHTTGSDFIPDQDRPQGHIRVTPLIGLGKHNPLNRCIMGLLNEVQHHITLCTPYFNPPKELEKAMSRLLQQHNQVTLVVGDKTANDFYIPADEPYSTIGALPYLYETNLRTFIAQHQQYLDSGHLIVRVWQAAGHTYHVKGIFADNQHYLLTGSNLNPRAWGLDLENGLLLTDPDKSLENVFNAELARICAETRVIHSVDALDDLATYPEPIRKLLKRLQRLQMHVLLKKLL